MIEQTIIPGYMHPLLRETIQIMEEAAFNDVKRTEELLRPCMMLKPYLHKIVIMQDETETCMWLAEFGDVCGFGYTPEDAYLNFDKVWSCP